MSFKKIYKFDTEMKWNEELLQKCIDEFKAKAYISINKSVSIIS